jgi:hypothetical protein
MRHMSESVLIAAPAERTFGYVDDIRHLAGHMTENSSMAMMGSKLKLEIVSPRPTRRNLSLHGKNPRSH